MWPSSCACLLLAASQSLAVVIRATDLWETVMVSRSAVMHPILHLRRPIVPSDWGRVSNYSNRIKSLKFLYERPSLSEAFEALRGSVPTDHLLPNLQSLGWRYHEDADPSPIELFLGPRLSSISLFRCDDETQRVLLPTLTHRYPALRTVAISVALPNDQLVPPTISTFIRSLTHVTRLDLDNCLLDDAALMHLGELTTLQHIGLVLPALLSFPASSAGKLFTNLRVARLQVLGAEGGALTSFLQAWATPPVESFAVIFRHPATVKSVEELYCGLAAHCLHPSLKTISVDSSISDTIPADTTQSGSLIRHLFCFPNLASLYLYPPAGFDMDDATTLKMARAWPHLEVLCLVPNQREHASRRTLRSLYSLSRHCPRLQIITICFDATIQLDPPPMSEVERAALNWRILQLDVTHSPIVAALPTARYISAIFPGLTEITTFQEHHSPQQQTDVHQLWKEVEGSLRHISELNEAWAIKPRSS
ncbi:hypothetical protein DFH09DRAFT_1277265 [Mycena vulgaris]|nr:hypothetical protein DFH09DRAFT_1277265 [Mycena vulgaris]